ncbi:MAG: hypothetical protein OXE41_11475, partial [Gammaproteobacteria bacterium]|nr:hypothetical protein [Gammaproteobacteria bacterium]
FYPLGAILYCKFSLLSETKFFKLNKKRQLAMSRAAIPIEAWTHTKGFLHNEARQSDSRTFWELLHTRLILES